MFSGYLRRSNHDPCNKPSNAAAPCATTAMRPRCRHRAPMPAPCSAYSQQLQYAALRVLPHHRCRRVEAAAAACLGQKRRCHRTADGGVVTRRDLHRSCAQTVSILSAATSNATARRKKQAKRIQAVRRPSQQAHALLLTPAASAARRVPQCWHGASACSAR